MNHIAYKFRLYPNTNQSILMAKTYGCVRFIYNKMLEDKIDYYHTHKKMLKNTPAMYKKEYEWLKEVDSLALANAQLHLEQAFHNFFRDPKVGFPKFKSKKYTHNSYTTNYVNNNIKVTDSHLTLPKMGKIRMKQHRNVSPLHKIKSVTISQTASGRYYASILCEYHSVSIPKKVTHAIGLDYSMAELYISSEGDHPNFPKPYRNALTKLRLEQRRLSKMTQGSNNYMKQKRKIARIHERIAHQRKDFLHKQSRQITNAYDLVAIEDLNMKALSRLMHFGKSVSDNGWGMFTTFLSYKLNQEGKYFVKVDKWFPSSKTCSSCGTIKQELLLHERTYLCECGTILDRDYNAALNIREEGLRLIA